MSTDAKDVISCALGMGEVWVERVGDEGDVVLCFSFPSKANDIESKRREHGIALTPEEAERLRAMLLPATAAQPDLRAPNDDALHAAKLAGAKAALEMADAAASRIAVDYHEGRTGLSGSVAAHCSLAAQKVGDDIRSLTPEAVVAAMETTP
jgi:hypothetical protein